MNTQNFTAKEKNDDFDKPVMNVHIVRLNELLKVKASSISKKYRPVLQVVKYLAKEIRDNWDNAKYLQGLFVDDATRADINKTSWRDIFDILESRRKELEPKEVKAIVRGIESIDDANKRVVFSDNSVADAPTIDVLSDYLNRGYTVELKSWVTGRTCCQIIVGNTLAILKARIGEDKLNIVDKTNGGYAEYEVSIRKDEPKKAASKAAKTTSVGKQGKVGRKKINRPVGTIHPNGLWIWVEYQPGKFDWKSRKGWKWGANGRIAKQSETDKEASNEKTIKQLKKGELFRLKNSETAPVWVRGEYDRSSKKYSTYRYDDVCHERFVKGNTEVFTEFYF